MEPSPKKSRKRSAGPPAGRPEGLVFFVDRDTGGRLLAGALKEAGYSVELHDQHFDQATPDPFWIRRVAQSGWIILTCDREIARKEPERSLFGTAPTYTFILYALTRVRREERIALVLEVLPKLSVLVASAAPLGIHRVHTSGQVEFVAVPRPRFRLEDF